MVDFLVKLAVNTAALLIATRVVPRLDLDFGPTGQDWWRALAVAVLFGVVNTYIRPVLQLLSLPLTLVMFGVDRLRPEPGAVPAGRLRQRAAQAGSLDRRLAGRRVHGGRPDARP